MAPRALPSYDQVVSGKHRDSRHLQTLVLHGRSIVASENPECVLYELSSPPCEAMAHTYSITKVGSRSTTSSTAQPGKKPSQRRRHLYDFSKKRAFSLRDLGARVSIEGRSTSRRDESYRAVTLAGSLAGWTACTARGHFAVQVSLRDRLAKFDGVVWTDDDGLIVALETRPKRRGDGTVDEGEAAPPPRLSMHEALPAKDLDLLVACWMARLWMESKASLDASQSRPAGSVFTRLWRQQPSIAKLGGSTSTQYAG